MIWDKFKGLEKLIRQIVALVELRIPRRPPAGLGQLIEVILDQAGYITLHRLR